MTTFIRISQGVYHNQPILNQVFELVKPFRQGRAAGFVTVANRGEFPGLPDRARIRVSGPSAYDVVDAAEYVEPSERVSDAVSATPSVPVRVETDEEIMARMRDRFEILDDMSRAVIAGDIRAMIVSGPPGVGKSFGVERELDKAALFDKISNRRVRSEVIKGSTTALGLYATLYKYSDAGSVIVFDDSDDIFFDDTSLNILKAALDTSKRRRISWNSDSALLRREGIPDQFDFKGGVIFITNLNFNNIRSKKILDHIRALESRCHFVDLRIDNTRDKLLRIRQVVEDGMLADHDLTDDEKTAVVAFVADNVNQLREVSLRTVIKAADLCKAFPTKWQRLATSSLLRTEA
jgi:hypothetical protein